MYWQGPTPSVRRTRSTTVRLSSGVRNGARLRSVKRIDHGRAGEIVHLAAFGITPLL